MPASLTSRCLLAICAVVCVLSLSVPALAATGRTGGKAGAAPAARVTVASLAGQVRDGRPLQGNRDPKILVPNGLPVVSGAVVSIRGFSQMATTNAAGNFELRNLRIRAGATYTLVVRKQGFGQWQESGITLTPGGEPSQVYVQLQTAPQRLRVTRPAQPDNAPQRQPGTAPAAPTTPAVAGGCAGNSSGWTSQTEQPASIRVYITGRNPSGPPAGDIIDYDFTFYEQHVLPNEWYPSWELPALEAGAVAVRDYAWYFVVNGSKGSDPLGSNPTPNPCSFDVDDWTNYQDFQPSAPTQPTTNTAIADTSSYLYSLNSAIPETGFNAGDKGDSCGEDYGNSGTGVMSQWGSQTCAEGGDDFQQILAKYYGFSLAVGGSRDASVAVDQHGNIFAFWQSTSGDLEEAFYDASAQSWNGPSAVTVDGTAISGLGSSPSVAVGPQSSGGYGDQYVFWRGTDGDLHETFWNGSWNGPIDLGDGPMSSAPAAGVDGSGNEYVFWENPSGGLEETEWNGSAWDGQHQVTVNGDSVGPLGSSPTVAVASNGDQYVFWAGTGTGDLWEAFWNGSSWSGPKDLGDGPLASPPAAGVDGSGNEYVFWESTSGGLEETEWNGSSWGGAHQITVNGNSVGPLGSAPTVGVAPDGDQYVFWTGTGDADLWEAYWNGSSWNGPVDHPFGPLG
jgi:hypothetical protein